MSQQIQELINKIKSDGINEAEKKAQEIESDSRKRAEGIIKDAEKKAADIVVKAEQKGKIIEGSTKIALRQASRDMLLSLREEIGKVLMKIISSDVNVAFSAENLSALILESVKGYLKLNKDVSDITVTVSDKDLKKLKDGYITKLKSGIKDDITFRSSDSIDTGFTISFDDGRSYFDFSDASVIEYLGRYVNAEVAEILKESIE